jgi:diguanylate cyclase (GGDEF)-like protein/PAS domain S-box-containing protein
MSAKRAQMFTRKSDRSVGAGAVPLRVPASSASDPIGSILDGKPLEVTIGMLADELLAQVGGQGVVMICTRRHASGQWISSARGRQVKFAHLAPSEWPDEMRRAPASCVEFAAAGLKPLDDQPAASLPLRARASGFRCLVHAPVMLAGDAVNAGAVALYLTALPVDMDTVKAQVVAAASKVASHLRLVETLQDADRSGLRLSALASTVPGVLYQRVVRPDGVIRYTYISENAFDLFGVTAEKILSDPEALFQHYGPDYRQSFRQRLLKASQDMTMWDVEATIHRPDGKKRYTHAIAKPSRQSDGSVLWTGVILDATRIKEAEIAASAAEYRTRETIVESLSQGLLLFDRDDRLTLRNSHFLTLHPALETVVVPGTSYDDILQAELDPRVNTSLISFDANDELVDRLLRHGEAHLVYEREMAGDRCILVNEYKTPDGGTVVLYTDISELKRRERKIEHLAHHDALTGLANRVLFREKLEQAITLNATGHGCALFCLDLDRFKAVNDTLGHQIGDLLLKEVAVRIQHALRGDDVPCRLGGDEFAVVVQPVGNSEEMTSLAWRLLNAVSQPYEIQNHTIVIGTSIGIAVVGQDGDTPEQLLKNADLALYRAKTDGRGTFRFFEAEMDAKAQARRLMEMALRAAVAQEALEVHYQPLIDAHTSQIVGAEALVRWNHPDRGYVPPVEFIPLAEETGMINEIGFWVLSKACQDAARWPEDIRIAVNLSPGQFKNGDFCEFVKATLERTGLAANRLELEITETMLLRNTEENLKILADLKALGIRISMDDFGTGYSSLGNLRSFPFDKIKIDKSFIADLNKRHDAAAIVRAILTLGRSLGMTTTAEGVETRDQMAYLRAEGCIEIQGFYFSQAVTNVELIAFLDRQNGAIQQIRRQDDALPPWAEKTTATKQ